MVVLPVAPDVPEIRNVSFPRSARLLTPAAFTAVFEQRKARRGQFFHLHFGPAQHGKSTDSDGGVARLGIAVPKKLLKTAVHRNLVKRIARESFRQLQTVIDPRDYVLRLSSKLDPANRPLDRKAMTDDIRNLFAARLRTKPPTSAESLVEQKHQDARENKC